MKNKLTELGLTEIVVDQILNAYDSYQQCIENYKRPTAKYKDKLKDIEILSKQLSKKMFGLTPFERQMLILGGFRETRELKQNLFRLNYASETAQKKKVKISKKHHPFLLDLTQELREILEQANIKVTKYRGHILIHILQTLFPERNNIDDPDCRDSEWAFSILQNVINKFPKNPS